MQSEEVQRLRKRRKAETMRLCDIERRQKQRIEEVRETQKKVYIHDFINYDMFLGLIHFADSRFQFELTCDIF